MLTLFNSYQVKPFAVSWGKFFVGVPIFGQVFAFFCAIFRSGILKIGVSFCLILGAKRVLVMPRTTGCMRQKEYCFGAVHPGGRGLTYTLFLP